MSQAGAAPRSTAGNGTNGDAALEAGLEKRLSSVEVKTRRKIEDWAKKLVDLSKRNRLLYYRATKRTTLTFQQPSADQIFTRLVDGGYFTFYHPPELPPVVPGRQRETTPLDAELLRRKPLERELVTTHRDPSELDRSLEAIDRKARAEFEDRGTRVLYLAWDLLRWIDPKSGEDQHAPLVLIPLELSRSSVTQPYQLRAADDAEPFLNPALRVMLEVDFNLALPELDVEELPPADIVEEIRGTLPRTWAVESHASIGIFGFAKEAMYRDLVDHAEVVARHSVIRSMVKGQLTAELAKALDVAVPEEGELDLSTDPGFSVVDADSSQRRAIEAANRGLSFVLHGPPGTGKSQTITNIIAEFIGRGKSVLFVSQKMAALEVVAKRLQETELRDLVLELHSAKASRGEVARSLAQALETHPQPRDSTVARTFTEVQANRETLNAYVAALHQRRDPLAQSAFDVLADLASLANVPAIEGPTVDAVTATPADLSVVIRSAQRLQDAWMPVGEGAAFPWWHVAIGVSSAAERDSVRDLLLRTREAVTSLEALDRQLGSACEWPMPTNQDERRKHALLGVALAERQQGPIEWLTTDDLSPYADLLARWEERAARHASLVMSLESSYGPRWRELRPEMADELEAELAAMEAALGQTVDWDKLATAADSLIATAKEQEAALAEVRARLATLDQSLGIIQPDSRAGASGAIEVARISQGRNRPPKQWLSRARLSDAQAFISTYGHLYTDQQRATTRFNELYEDGLLSLDLDPLAERMGRWHGHWWHRLRRQYRADRAAIAAMTRTRTLQPTVIADLAQARELRDARLVLGGLAYQEGAALGPYAQGLTTDVVAIGEAIAAAERLLDLPAGSVDWVRLSAVASADAPYDPDVERQADGLAEAIATAETILRQLVAYAASDKQAVVLDWDCNRTLEWAAAFSALLRQLRHLREDIASTGAFGSMVQAIEQARIRSEIESIESDLDATEPVLRAALRAHYAGFATDWPTLRGALAWAAALREAYGRELPERVAREAMSGGLDNLLWRDHEMGIAALDTAAQAMAAIYSKETSASVEATLAGPASGGRLWIDERLARVEDLAIWNAYRSAHGELVKAGWGRFADDAARRGIAPESLAPAARRAWLEAWFASLSASQPVLGAFSRAEHERIVGIFRGRDVDLVSLGRERVLREYANRKPRPATVQGGEQAIVRREALKRRRHLPVRTLLDSIPTLLPKIKPCLMMSPLSVSHFLTAGMTFDLVVFDEASQVPPEDAVNCIYRGRQLIVAGDPKQLPPTDFFQLSAISEQDGDFEEDIGDFESVLDLCLGIGLRPHSLEWHYRSRDDALIAFSNHFIYEDSLVTFPAPFQHSDDLGVSFVYVPDAVFDRGRTASNPVEASRVADLVVDHWKRHPEQSIGVVAFSVSQQEAVQDELARRIRIQPDLERSQGEGRLDAFFVKNLETVQGDERDVIVFTIGYGRDEQGRVFNNFGALNRPGGARRLNVAVTRARRRVVVVSSIRASDLRLPDATAHAGSLPPGAALLRAYLDYAEHGVLPEAVNTTRAAEITPLEEDIAHVIRDLGYEVVERVGTSRYRIDLGVVSKVRPGRLALGVESDGAMYSDAQTARDRDRLREAVLRGLDWSVIRMWAPAWYFNRQVEIERLSQAITAAEQRIAAGRSASDAPPQTLPSPAERPVMIVPELRVDGPEDAIELGWAVPYTVTPIAPYRTSAAYFDFSDAQVLSHHVERLAALVAGEGPVHEKVIETRLSRAYGLGRAGNRIALTVTTAISLAERDRKVSRRGSFVWPTQGDVAQVRVPVKGQDETERAIHMIAPEEIELALMRVTETAGSIDPGTLRMTVARIFGFERTGGRIDDSLEVRVNALIGQKRLALSGGAVVLGQKAALPEVPVRASRDEFPAGSWVRHPRLGVGRVVRTSGTIVSIDFNGEVKQIETKVIQLVSVPAPK